MTRLSAVLMAAGLAAGAVGCAHCDTCDDFPTPCVGPNCGGGPMGVYAMSSGPVSYSAPAGAALGPANDGAGPAPTAPAAGTPPAAAPPTPSPFESKPTTPSPTPPLPGEPTAPRSRPGS
jgi:hypothetical protein